MEEKEKEIAETLAQVISKLSEGKKEYFMGFAEGVAVMAEHNKENDPDTKEWAEHERK